MSSEEKKPEASEGSGGSKLPMILGLVNVVALLALLGLVVYTRVLFKRPKITESSERRRLEDQTALEATQKRNFSTAYARS